MGLFFAGEEFFGGKFDEVIVVVDAVRSAGKL